MDEIAPLATGWTDLAVSDGTTMRAYLSRPSAVADTAEAAGIIVLQEAFGVNDYIQRTTARLATLGYVAIAPELFHRAAPGFDASYETREGVAEQMAALTDVGIVADIGAAREHLLSLGVRGERIAIIGFCMGGRAAFLANIEFPIAASVSFYGGGIAPALAARAAEVHAPVLLIWGGQDGHIPATDTRAVADALAAAGKPFVEATFSEAGHGFACDARGSYHAKSAGEAWALSERFLAEHL